MKESNQKRTKEFYRQMKRIRNCELKISELYHEQKMRCPIHLCVGQEAVPVGISSCLRLDDNVFSNHRSHGHYLAKGGDMNAMLAEFYGKKTGCAGGKGGSQHLIDLSCNFMGSAPILASTISVAVGAAWAAKLNGSDVITVCYFGDGATEEGAFYESLNFAKLKNLNILFICENNLYSVHTKVEDRRPKNISLCNQVKSFGLNSYVCDGNDVLKVSELTSRLIKNMRLSPNPHFVEAKTYRWLEHCGPDEDFHLGYRTLEEINAWKKFDPLNKLEPLLEQNDILEIEKEVNSEIKNAFIFAEDSEFPNISELFTNVFPKKDVMT
jgi:TPP-dependent pyruvate/acetoin dehydrogenase alpha subunit